MPKRFSSDTVSTRQRDEAGSQISEFGCVVLDSYMHLRQEISPKDIKYSRDIVFCAKPVPKQELSRSIK